jgi:hypothetical protein
MTTAMRSRNPTTATIDKKIGDLWASYLRIIDRATPADHARLWRQIDTLLDKRLELMT